MSVRIGRPNDRDFDHLAAAFEGWPKPAALFHRYARQVEAGEVEMCVAWADDGRPAGYCLVVWKSQYPPFAEAGIPEISDLNVLPSHRGGGVGRGLLDAAESIASARSDIVGLLVGLYGDYGVAQQMYARCGYVPDGRGVILEGKPVAPGAQLVLDDGPGLALTRDLRSPRTNEHLESAPPANPRKR